MPASSARIRRNGQTSGHLNGLAEVRKRPVVPAERGELVTKSGQRRRQEGEVLAGFLPRTLAKNRHALLRKRSCLSGPALHPQQACPLVQRHRQRRQPAPISADKLPVDIGCLRQDVVQLVVEGGLFRQQGAEPEQTGAQAGKAVPRILPGQPPKLRHLPPSSWQHPFTARRTELHHRASPASPVARPAGSLPRMPRGRNRTSGPAGSRLPRSGAGSPSAAGAACA
ncbi:hypothetical protein GCM10018773_31450 [Streptomyces candidus]|nr:hypothetical protein GCM10018773_31450 [Streptomyces candidus]